MPYSQLYVKNIQVHGFYKLDLCWPKSIIIFGCYYQIDRFITTRGYTCMTPIKAVAYWVNIHSIQLGAQTPKRSPLFKPIANKPQAISSA